MSFLISFIVFSIKQIWPFAILGLIVGFWATSYFRPIPSVDMKVQKRRKQLRNFFQSFVVLLPGAAFLFGMHITNPLINYAGIETTGVVMSQEETSTLRNNQRVYQMNVAYLVEGGKLQQSSFRTDEFNFYPNVGRSAYPKPGQEFKLKYLPQIPRYFVILDVS